jgi:hypothetical protein
MQASEAKFVFETCVVSAFEKFRAQHRVDFDSCPDDSFGDVVMHHEKLVSVSSASSAVESFGQQMKVER